MDGEARIQSLRRRAAAAGIPVYVGLATLSILAFTGRWQDVASNLLLSIAMPQITVMAAATLTAAFSILGSFLSFVGLSAKEAQHNVALLLGGAAAMLPLVGLFQAIALLV